MVVGAGLDVGAKSIEGRRLRPPLGLIRRGANIPMCTDTRGYDLVDLTDTAACLRFHSELALPSAPALVQGDRNTWAEISWVTLLTITGNSN